MSGTDPTFSCPLCGEQFPWQPEYAGRKLACACGNLIEIAASATSPSEDDLYDLRDDGPPAAVPAIPFDEPPPGQLSLDSTGQEIPPAKAARVLSYRRIAAAETLGMNDDARTRRRDVWIPLGMLTFSAILLTLLALIISNTMPVSASAIAAHLGLRIIWDLVMTLIAGTVIYWWVDAGFGEFNTALLKLSAIALLRFSISAIIAPDSNIGLAMLGFLITFPMLIFLFGYLFEFDFTESLFSAVVLSLMRLISYFGLWRIL